MKKFFLFICLLIAVFSFGQPTGVPNYTDINNQYNWRGAIFRRLNVPVGTTAALQSGQPGLAGAIYADSTGGDKGLYWYRDGVWVKLLDSTMASPLTLAAIGSTANANGMTYSGGVLNLQPASSSFGGVITTGTQSFDGSKTFLDDVVINDRTIGRGTSNQTTNVAFGNQAIFSNTTGTVNLAIGNSALRNNTNGGNNVAIGSTSMGTTTTAGNFNTAIGHQSLANNTANYNTAVGYNSLNINTTGTQNVSFGYNALGLNSTAQKNAAFGAGAMENTSTGGFNTGLGMDALLQNTTGIENTGVGWLGWSQNRTGTNNVGVGSSSGRTIINGSRNVFIGSESGYLDTSGATSQNDTLDNSIAIGYRAYTTASNQMWLGNGSINDTRIEGLANGLAPKRVLYDPTTKKVYYSDTTSGGGGGTNFANADLTLTANRSHSLDSKTLNISQGANSFFGIDPTPGAEISYMQAYNTTGSDNSGIWVGETTNTQANSYISASFNSSAKVATVEAIANTGLSSVAVNADSVYLSNQKNNVINDSINQKILTINTSTGSLAMSNWIGSGGGVAQSVITDTLQNYWRMDGNIGGGTKLFGTTSNNSVRIYTNNLYRGKWDSLAARLEIGSPSYVSNRALAIQQLTNTTGEGIRIYPLNNSTYSDYGYGGILTPSSFTLQSSSVTSIYLLSGRAFFGASTSPTARIEILAGTTSVPPMKFNSGSLATGGNILAGNFEFLTDKWYGTISTGPAQKEFTMNDAALTSGVTPVATTNGRLTDGLTISASTYSPTLTTITNLDGATVSSCQYMRVGNTVTVSGKITANPTATGATSFRITLPVASDFGATEHCGGVAFAKGIAGLGAEIYADTGNNEAKFEWIAVDLTDQEMGFTFTYQIIVL